MKFRLFALPSALVLVATITSSAVAQKRGDEKDDLATEEKAAQHVVRPDEARDVLQEAENVQVEALIAEKEKQLSEVRLRQIASMRQILEKNPLYKNKADLLFRIAEKEWEEAKYRYFLERKQYEKEYDAFMNGTLKKRPDEPKADYGKALVEYKTLLKEFPNYSRIDEVMFYLGRGLITAGKKKQGASYMLRLTKEYPKSKFLTRAYLAVAEYYFENDLLFAAKTNYLKVLDDKESSEYPYALYKLGYVHYNLKEFDDSIKAFQQVVDLSKGGDKRKLYFTQQAYAALCLSFAEIADGWKQARDYFRATGGAELEVEQLERIARIFSTQDKTDDEIAVYEYLVGRDKQGKKIPEYADNITKAYKKLEDLDKTDEVINRFLTYFDPKGPWYAVNKTNEEAKTRADQYREAELDFLIASYHKKAQDVEALKDQARADKLYAKAAVYYERFIAEFPESKDLYEMEFFLAEIYFFQTKEWDKAALHYRAVVNRDPKGKYSKESAYAVILAMEERMADAGVIDRPDRSDKGKKGKAQRASQVEYTSRQTDKDFKPKEEKPLHSTEQDFLNACKEYVEIFPKDDEVPFVSFRAAEIFINKGHYAEGVKRLEVIMEHHSSHEYAGHAAATLFDANYRLRRWHEMERWGRYMLDRKNYAVLSKDQLRDVIAISINEYATELSQNGQKDKAAAEMLRFVKEFPKHDKAPIALFNAAAITEEAEKTEEAIDLYESLISRYSKSAQATEAHFVLGALYESQTDFEKAAEYFEKMASFPDVPQMADALYNAGAIRAALEQYEKAIAIYETYVKKFPDRDDTPAVYLRIAEFQQKRSDWKGALKTYDQYIAKYAKSKGETLVEAYLRKAKAYIAEGGKDSRKNASRELEAALKVFKKLPEQLRADRMVLRAAADARRLQGEFVYADFEAVQVRFPDSVLQRTLVQKATLLEETNKIFFEVLESNSHEVSAGALYRLGESYYLFAKSLFDLPVPDELNEDEKIVYRAQLDDKASPLQEKAIEALRRALSLAHKNHVYNEWSRRSASLLVKLSPEAFPVLDDAVVNSEWDVPATFSTTYIQDPKGKLELVEQKAQPAPVEVQEAPKAVEASGEVAPGSAAQPSVVEGTK